MVQFCVSAIMLHLLIEYFIIALPRALQTFVWGTIGGISGIPTYKYREDKNMPKNNPSIDYRWSAQGL